MSEQEAGAVVEPVVPVEPVEPTEPVEPDEAGDDGGAQIEGDDADEGDGEGGEGGEGGEQEQESQGRALTEKEIDVRGQRLDKENVRHATRVSDIMADDAPNLIPCPVCMDGIAGWVFLPEVAQLPPEAITRIRQLLGLPDLTTYQQATFAERCPDCEGMGEVKTGSLVNGYEVTTCETCKKTGWKRTDDVPTNGYIAAPVESLVTGPTVAGPEQNDPEIAHLRERGFTVIPPMQPVNP